MHAKKQELLTKLDESSRSFDAALGHLVDVLRHPRAHGWRSSLGAAVVGLPLIGVGAVIVDVSEVLVSRSTDAEWQRAFPGEGPDDRPTE